jgi:hypothetical protein
MYILWGKQRFEVPERENGGTRTNHADFWGLLGALNGEFLKKREIIDFRIGEN